MKIEFDENLLLSINSIKYSYDALRKMLSLMSDEELKVFLWEIYDSGYDKGKSDCEDCDNEPSPFKHWLED